VSLQHVQAASSTAIDSDDVGQQCAHSNLGCTQHERVSIDPQSLLVNLSRLLGHYCSGGLGSPTVLICVSPRN
jgi:hypothetical protein